MKSAILSPLVGVIILVFFAYSNQILAGIFKRVYFDSLNPNNEQSQVNDQVKKLGLYVYM